MGAADDVANHIHGSLLDLRRRLDDDVVIQVARAVIEGASRALEELTPSAKEATAELNGATQAFVKH